MKRAIFGLGGLAVSALFIAAPLSIAGAADMAVKAPAPAPTCVWCGWYVGVDGGGGWEHTTWTYPNVNFYDTAVGQGFRTNPRGGLYGGHIGFNSQNGSWVFGAEFTGDWANLKQTQAV